MVIKIGGFNDLSVADTDKIAFGIYFQGCRRRCPGCHNPELQTFDGGETYTTREIIRKVYNGGGLYQAVAIMGGEPLEQKEGLVELLKGCRDIGVERWLYTGYDETSIPSDVISLCSVIIAGEYLEELRTEGFPASSNQRVINLTGRVLNI